MATMLTHSSELDDSNPSVTLFGLPRSCTVLVRAGSVVVDPGGLPDPSEPFTLHAGETVSWAANSAQSGDLIALATISIAEPGTEALVVWMRR